MRPIVVTVGPLANASATNIRTASSGSAGALVLNGSLVSSGVAYLDKPRRVLITNAADETGKTVVLTGTNWSGNAISETVTLGGIGSTASVLSYATLSSAVLSANSSGTLSIGTNGVATSPWVFIDSWAAANIAMQATVSGTVNYTIQSTLDDPNSPINPVTPALMTWVSTSDTAAVGATTTVQTNYLFSPAYIRVLLNSGTGSVTLTVTQSNVVSL